MARTVIAEVRSDGKGGVIAACTECDYETKSKGESEASRKRCLALLREGCPKDKEHFYVDSDNAED